MTSECRARALAMTPAVLGLEGSFNGRVRLDDYSGKNNGVLTLREVAQRVNLFGIGIYFGCPRPLWL